jgi:hypothetical protein
MKPNTRAKFIGRGLALSVTLVVGMSLGILYAYRNPIQVGFVCRIQIPEFLIPSTT